jgi:hypothetical protein
MTYFNSRYGPIPIGRVDISGDRCLSVDLRSLTDPLGKYTEDLTRIVPPGTFTLSVFDNSNNDWQVGEILMDHEGVEVSMVVALTNRPGVVEITPDHVTAASLDDNYLNKLLLWVKPMGEA